MDIKKSFDSFFIVQPDNTFLGLKDEAFFIVKEDGTEIISYIPDRLRAVTLDCHGNLFMVMADGVQVMHPKKECIQLAFYEAFDNHHFIGFHSFSKKRTRLLLVTKIIPTDMTENKERKFGKNQSLTINTYCVNFLCEA